MICSNCQSTKHLECCAQCGRIVPPKRRGKRFCTMRCQNLQAAQDRLSAQMEEAFTEEKADD